VLPTSHTANTVHRHTRHGLRQLVVAGLVASTVPLVGLLAFDAAPAAASPPAVVCGTSDSTLTVTVSGQSTSGDPLGIEAVSGDYVVYLGTSSDTQCTNTSYSLASYPNVDIDSSGTSSQYVMVDDNNGQLASAAAGCPTTFDVGLDHPSSGTNTLAVSDDSSDPAPGDDVTEVSTTSSSGSTTESLTLAAFADGSCSAPDVTVASTTAPPSIVVVGQGSTLDELDLFGHTSSSTSYDVNVAGDSTNDPGTVSGEPGGVGIDFSGISIVLAPDFPTVWQPGTFSGFNFIAQPGDANTLDLSDEDASASGLAIDATNNTFVAPGSLTGTSSAGTSLDDTFSGFATFIGSPEGTAFAASASGGLDFEGLGSANSIDFSDAPGGASVTANGNTLVSPAVVSGLDVGFNSLTTDDFNDVQTVTGSLPPSEPTNVVATPTGGATDVSFSPSAFDGGSPITKYTVTADDHSNGANGGQTNTGSASPITVSGLTGGDSYTFTVTASNTNGTGPTSVASAAITALATQTVGFTSTSPGEVRVGAPSYTPIATASSGLTASITLDAGSTGCTLTTGVVHFTAIGSCVIDANQSGDSSYAAASQVQQTIMVLTGLTTQTVGFTSTSPGEVRIGAPSYTPTATASSGLAASITLDAGSTGCTLITGVVHFTAVGSCVIDANQSGDSSYASAPQVQQTITVLKAIPIISITSKPPAKPVVGGTYRPAATSTSNDTVAISLGASSKGCAIASGLVTFTATETCVIVFTDPGSASDTAAAAHQVVAIGKADVSITTTASPSTASKSTTITLRARLSRSDATGVIVFRFGAESLCSASIHAGVASCRIARKLATGHYVVTAIYSGNADLNRARGTTSIRIT
jgi:hypothetical protein